MGAALLSALVLAVVNITVYVIPFLAQGPLQFAACGLDGIWEWGTPWFDWTYGTYLLVLAGLILALSLGAAAAVCAIIAYWDKLAQLGSCAKTKIQRTACASEYDDYEE